jgi:hypothetical protein
MSEQVTADTVTYDPSADELVLYFVEDGPWPEDDNAFAHSLKRIQDRILDAVDACIDGGVAAAYPDSLGKKIRIQVDSPNRYPEKLDNLISNVNKYLADTDEYASAINASKFVAGIRVVSGHTIGRFRSC